MKSRHIATREILWEHSWIGSTGHETCSSLAKTNQITIHTYIHMWYFGKPENDCEFCYFVSFLTYTPYIIKKRLTLLWSLYTFLPISITHKCIYIYIYHIYIYSIMQLEAETLIKLILNFGCHTYWLTRIIKIQFSGISR